MERTRCLPIPEEPSGPEGWNLWYSTQSGKNTTGVSGFPAGTRGNPPANAGDIRHSGFDPWVGKTPWRREQKSTPAFLPEDPMDRGAWWATVHRVAKSRTQLKQLSMHIGVSRQWLLSHQGSMITNKLEESPRGSDTRIGGFLCPK